MPWHPPIPFGALYSEDALQIGPALSLLGYCYDKVSREDGTLRLNLRTAASEMGVPYPTVKRWWELLKETGYIASHKERGRAGMDVRMSDDWLDWWREDQETRSKTIPNKKETGQKREKNERKTVSEMIPNTAAYKVLNTTDQATDQEREHEDQDRTERTLSHPAVAAYQEAFPSIRLTDKQAAIITALVGEGVERLECWQEVIQDYELSTHWKPENIGNMRSRFDTKVKEREQRNGTRQQHRNGRRQYTPPSPEWAGWTEADTDKPL